MEADWDEIHRITVTPGPREQPTPPSTLAFDTQQELLWIGNEYGRVTSYYGPELQRYTSIQAHPASDGPVKQMLFHEKGVISVAPSSVHLALRRGLTQWHLGSDTGDDRMRDLRCMSFLGKDNVFIIVAGCQDVMLKIDVEKGRVVEKIASEHEYTMMKRSHYICAATSSGSVNILDSDNLRIVKILSTNNVGISDMDARNNYLVTCGWATRPGGTPMLASLANVYDLRAMVQLPPIAFHAGAAHVQMHPRMSTTCIIASQSGQLQVVDLMNANTVNLRQANIASYMSYLILAPSGEALALSDHDGYVHLWGSPSKLQFAEYSSATEFADTPAPITPIDVDADTPLNSVGMPYYREQLLSVLSNSQIYEVGNLPVKIDTAIFATLRPYELGMYGPNPRKGRRNLAEKTRIVDTNGSTIAAPKFLSEKARDAEREQKPERRISDVVEALANAALSGSTKADVPIMYRNVEIKYSKFGVDDFDFEFYNKTKYSGLETHISNSYTNPLLQLFKFTPLLRNVALRHTASTCLVETCLLCEMGFLFDMMDKAEGQSCQATNFLKTFSNIPEAARLGLLEENSQTTSLAAMLQSASRFLLEQTSLDFRKIQPDALDFDQALALDAHSSIRCVHCHNETIRSGGTYINDLVYQPLTGTIRARNQFPTFSQILKASIERETQTRGWCDKCRRYQQLATRKSVHGVPMVLMINAALKTAESKQYWAIPGWLPDTIGVIVDNGKFFCFEGEDLRLHLQRGMHVVTVYDLVGFVADINSGENQRSHLVSMINVGISSRDPTQNDRWHLFNDFLVRNLTKEDALQFFPSWKLPAVLAYQVSSARHAVDDTWKDQLDTTLLYYDWSLNGQRPQHSTTLDVLTESPQSGTHVAIDTEFVALQQEEIEIKADGEREIIRPTRLGLARVSVLRGSGVNEGTPFINDYITITSEPVVDYLTTWSGIHEGDLDPHLSTHPLVPLKVAYKKLWLLLNSGVIFIGHGLPKDFRTINIHVPRTQVIDTVELFYSRARQRKLSLRFLAWYLLKEEIQSEEHDSIEDARTALRLWRKWEEFIDAGIEAAMIDEVYREGKKWGYKPPGETQVLSGGGPGGGGGGGGGATRKLREMRSTATDASAGAGTGVGSLGGGLSIPGGSQTGGTSTSTGGASGRDTPEILQQQQQQQGEIGISGPGTPVGRKLGRGSEFFESPLR